MVESAIEEILT